MMIQGSNSRTLAIALAVSLALASSSALAQSAAEKQTARTQFEEGKQKRDRGDFAGALQAFRAADAIMQVPTTRLAVARAHASLGNLVEASEAAVAVGLIPVAPKEPQPFTDARLAAKELIAELAKKVPTLSLKLIGTSAGDEPIITVDGAKLPKEAWAAPQHVNPGKHVVVGALQGREAKAEITIAEGETKDATIDLTPVLKTTQPIEPVRPVDSSEGSRSPLLWIGLGVAVVGVGVGTTTGLLSMSKTSDVDAGCRDNKCPPATHDALDSANTLATISTIGFIGAGIGAALAGVGLALGKTTKTGSSTQLTIGALGPGIGLRGGF